MYTSVYDLFRQPPYKNANEYNAQDSYDALLEIQNYFNKSTPDNPTSRSSIDAMYLNHIYLPFKYYNQLKEKNNCGYRDGYSCWYMNGNSGAISSGYVIYIYDHVNDQFHYMGFYNKKNPVDNTTYALKNYGKCSTTRFYVICGKSNLDDFMYSNKSSEIFVTALYFFIPVLLFIIGIKVLKKGFFK